MINMVQQPDRNARKREDGGTLVLVTFFMVALFGFTALSVDVGRVYDEQRRMNFATDAGALAGAAKLTNKTQVVQNIIDEATVVAQANGVTGSEIASGSRKGFPGQVQVGRWTNGVFEANQTVGGRYTAVRVPARRTVELAFGKVVGLSGMRPAVDSVAMLTGAGNSNSPIPFGIGIDLMAGKDFGANNMLVIDGKQSPGNWGKLNIDGATANGAKHYEDAVASAVAGSGPSAAVDQVVSSLTGVAGLENGLQKAVGQEVAIPITSNFGNGSGPVTILGFVLAVIEDISGGGNNTVITIRLVSGLTGSTGGGPGGSPFAQARTLVE